MVARIILVHDDREFLTGLEHRLQDGGHNVVVFEDSNIAFDALKGPTSADVLVTQDQFRPGQPPGVALARVAHVGRPSLKVIFIAHAELAQHVGDYGRVFLVPVTSDQIGQAVEELLNAPPSLQSPDPDDGHEARIILRGPRSTGGAAGAGATVAKPAAAGRTSLNLSSPE